MTIDNIEEIKIEDNLTESINQQDEAYYRFGNTNAYKQSHERTSKYTKYEMERIIKIGGDIYKELSLLMDLDPSDPKVQELVQKWRDYISTYFYDCTLEILSGLGKAYVLDPRFKKNIDSTKEGLAEFLSKAIEIYCNKY